MPATRSSSATAATCSTNSQFGTESRPSSDGTAWRDTCWTCDLESAPRSSKGGEVMGQNTLAAIDVGGREICTVGAGAQAGAGLRILGVAVPPAQGANKGMVDNIQQATDAISTSIERAEKSSGSRIVSAHVSIGGNHVQSLNNRGIATIPGKQ